MTGGPVLPGTIGLSADVVARKQSPVDYAVWIDGSLYRADSMRGTTDYQSADAATVIQNAINALTTGGKIFIQAGTYPLTNPLTLKTGVSIQGVAPQLTNRDPAPPSLLTFSGGTILSGSGIDCFTGNLLRSVTVQDIGLSGFVNGFNHGATNVLGMAQSCLSRVFFSNVALPINVTNFQFLRLDQIYASLPTTNFILAKNDHTGWGGGNSLWTDLYATGCRNVNGAVSLIAITKPLNMIECHRLQVNMSDGTNNSTSGYGLYLQGQSGTALCSRNQFLSLDIENFPLDTVRLEDFAQSNHIHLAFDQTPSAGGFSFSLKKNLTTTAPLYNTLVYTSDGANAATCKVESDNFNNLLYSSVPLVMPTGTYPAGIQGVVLANFGGAVFQNFIGGGARQSFVGGTSGAGVTNATAPATFSGLTLPTTQDVEIACEIRCSAFTSGPIQIQVSFTDRGGTARTVILPVNNNGTFASGITGTGYWSTPTIKISTLANVLIQVATIGTFVATYSGNAFYRAAA